MKLRLRMGVCLARVGVVLLGCCFCVAGVITACFGLQAETAWPTKASATRRW
jgi:hypothetical protein